MRNQKSYSGAMVAIGIFAIPNVAYAACDIGGYIYSNGTCRRVSAYAGSNGTSDQENFLDSATSAEADLTLGSGFSYFDGHSSADLTTGKLRAYIDTIGGGSANASWLESVKFDLPDGVDSLVIPISVSLNGINTEGISAFYNNIGMSFFASSYGNSNHFDVFQVVKNCGFEKDFTDAICKDGPVSIEYADELTIWEDVVYQFAFSINVGGTHMTQDFGHTASFSWVLPENVGFASSSGQFMTAAAAPGIPEPATWATMLLGFGFVGFALRRGQCQSLQFNFA